jgi:hypothetical protein
MGITGAEAEVARHLLDAMAWDLDSAVGMFLETKAGAGGGGSSSMSSTQTQASQHIPTLPAGMGSPAAQGIAGLVGSGIGMGMGMGDQFGIW